MSSNTFLSCKKFRQCWVHSFKICELLMLTCPCYICWLCKAMIAYYIRYRVNTHKEDEKIETKWNTKCKWLTYEDKRRTRLLPTAFYTREQRTNFQLIASQYLSTVLMLFPNKWHTRTVPIFVTVSGYKVENF